MDNDDDFVAVPQRKLVVRRPVSSQAASQKQTARPQTAARKNLLDTSMAFSTATCIPRRSCEPVTKAASTCNTCLTPAQPSSGKENFSSSYALSLFAAYNCPPTSTYQSTGKQASSALPELAPLQFSRAIKRARLEQRDSELNGTAGPRATSFRHVKSRFSNICMAPQFNCVSRPVRLPASPCLRKAAGCCPALFMSTRYSAAWYGGLLNACK